MNVRSVASQQFVDVPDQARVDLVAIFRTVRRRWLIVLAATLTVVTLCVLYSILTPPKFTATATVVMEPRRVNIFRQDRQDNSVVGDLPVDNITVESQLTIMRSEAVLGRVIQRLDLLNDAEYVNPTPSLPQQITSALKGLFVSASPEPLTQEQRMRAVMDTVRSQLTVQRTGLSHTIEISHVSSRPAQAAAVANAIAEAYLQDQIDSAVDTSQRASTWLQERLDQLREQAIGAETAVLDFKTENNLLDVGGAMVFDRQIAEVNTQLSQALFQTGEFKARLDQIETVLASEDPNAAVGDMLRNEVIQRLKTQQADASKREVEFAARYPAGHPVLLSVRSEIKEIQRGINEELRRIAEAVRSDLAVSRAREQFLRSTVRELSKQATTSRLAQIKLRDLESAGQSYRTLYDNLLQRYHLVVQQQSFQIAGARIITRATQPTAKSWPKTSMLLGIGLLSGLGLGVGGALLRQYMSREIENADQAEQATGTRSLGSLPVVSRKQLPPRTALVADVKHRQMLRGNAMLSYASDVPFARFAETLRTVKVTLDTQKSGRSVKIIGVTSTLLNEGKSTVSANLGHLIAETDSRVILIDADLRQTSLTRSLAPQASAGLIEVLNGKLSLNDALWRDSKTGLEFLPAVLSEPVHNTDEVISSAAMKELLDAARQLCRYVILDLPPLVPVADVQAAAHLIDGFVFVVRAQQTPADAVRRALASAGAMRERIIGTVLNRVDPNGPEATESYGPPTLRTKVPA